MTATASFPRPRTWLLAAASAAALGSAAMLPVFAQTSTADIPIEAQIATTPLYAYMEGDRPVMLLAPSVEFPTVGAQHRGDTYSPDEEYVGYYNHNACYEYKSGVRYFAITRMAPRGEGKGATCGGAREFSGNFLNWASSSNIDMMRLALTGGDRVIDEPGRTVLQRAYLPEGTAQVSSVTLSDGSTKGVGSRGPGCFFNNASNFKSKKLTQAQAAGAVPPEMISEAGSADIYIANMGNRIYFGTANVGQDCTNGPAKYTLGSGSASITSLPASAVSGTPGTECASRMTWGGDGADSAEWTSAANGIAARLRNGKACKPYNDDTPYRLWLGSSTNGWLTGVFTGQVACTTNENPPAGGDYSNGWSSWMGWKPTSERYFTAAAPAASGSDSGNRCYWSAATELDGESNSGALNADGFFFARVQVCDDKDERDYEDSKGGDFGYCREYSQGKKPVGVIQKYADALRVGIFGYAIDQTAAHGSDAYKGRFGGVLRAPVKYVGPNVYNASGRKTSSSNERAEWNAETGVLVADPEQSRAGASKYGVSGVINYFNRFGRNPNLPGNYKQFDNVGELYFEALRYLQGHPVTPAAVQNLDERMEDGFPAYTSWEGLDPFDSALGYSSSADYTCLKNSMLVIGDINTHDPVSTSHTILRETMAGNDASKNEIDLLHWRDVVRAFETKSATLAYKDGQGENRTTSNPNAATINAGMNREIDGTRNLWSLIPGMAYWAHTHDIRGTDWTAAPDKQRPGLRLTSYFFDVNEELRGTPMAYHYCARTGECNSDGTDTPPYAGGYWGNQYWLGAKYGGFATDKRDAVYNSWGNPFYQMDCTTTTDGSGNEVETCTQGAANNLVWSDLTKAQGENTDGRANPEPRTYYLPSNGRGVIKAFDAIFSATPPLEQRSIGGADSAGGIGSTSFQAEFDTGDWSGDVIAEAIVLSGDKSALRASENLPSHDARTIISATHTGGATTAYEFTTAGTPNEVKTVLGNNAISAGADDIINWLRGDQSKEGNGLRPRTRLIGDIINSGVKYVGSPAGQVNLGEGYSAYIDAQATRTAAVYVGANDGMLHAFEAGGKRVNAQGNVEDKPVTLTELFAYIPSWMAGKLADLADPTYLTKHQAYVDATPVIGDANLKADCTVTTTASGSTDDCKWRSVLVSGTGAGGRGVFALDVTDPTQFGADKVLWEFTDADDVDMGYVLGQSRIVKLFSHQEMDGTKVYRWFAMVPAGVNNYVADPDDANAPRGNGDANIFLLALDKPADQAWVLDTNYWKIRLPRIQALQATHPTGILNLEAFTGLGGVTEYVYAGDLHGQLWAFSFKDLGTSFWSAAEQWKLADPYTASGSNTIKPLYIAQNASGVAQPITVAPSILEGAGNGVHFVSFGTGKYFETGDALTTKIDTFYTVYSNFNTTPGFSGTRGAGDAIIPSRSYLQEVSLDRTAQDGTDYFKPAQAFYWGWRENAPGAGQEDGVRSGWYLDFAPDGERQIADASWISLTSRLMFSTLTPVSATETGVCGTGGGDSKLYTFDMISGKGTGRPSSVGMLAQPLVFIDTANAEETEADSTGRRLRISPVMSGQFGSGGSNVSQVDTVIVPFGRLSWRRIDNFQQLRKEGK